MFYFPRDETLRQEWIRQISNANLSPSPTKYTCACEEHFTVEEGIIFHVIVAWLRSWKFYNMNHPKSFLTNETVIALLHTIKTVLIMIADRLQHHNHKYICYLNFVQINQRVVLDYTNNVVAVIIWYQ